MLCLSFLRKNAMEISVFVGITILFYIFVALCLYLSPETPERPGCEEKENL